MPRWRRLAVVFFAVQCSGAVGASTWPQAADSPTPSPSLKALVEPASDADSFHKPLGARIYARRLDTTPSPARTNESGWSALTPTQFPLAPAGHVEIYEPTPTTLGMAGGGLSKVDGEFGDFRRRAEETDGEIYTYETVWSNSNTACSTDYELGSVYDTADDEACMALCSAEPECAFIGFNTNDKCRLYESCDETRQTQHKFNTYEKVVLDVFITSLAGCTANGGSGFNQCPDTDVYYCCDVCTGSYDCNGLYSCACVDSRTPVPIPAPTPKPIPAPTPKPISASSSGLALYLESAESCYDPSGQDCSCTSINIWDSCDCGGTVPSELSACTSLTKLSLNTGAMTGTIPPELSTLTSLTEVNFGSNRGMTGSFPAELSTLTSLQKIFMDKNSFTGAIPPEWSTLTSLTNLCVS